MNIRILLLASISLTLFGANGWAQQDDDGAEATIRLMDAAEAELPYAVTKEITLPANLLEESEDDQVAAVERAKKGLETANTNRARREQGLSQSDAARERGAEMSENAHDNRGDRGRSEDPPGPPENPGPPDNPGQP